MKQNANEFTQTDIERLAKLARIELTASEISQYTHDLAAIVEYVDKLQQLKTALSGSTLQQEVQLRSDQLYASAVGDELIQAAAQHEKNYVVVPPVFEEKGL